jgi:hypothetical protein
MYPKSASTVESSEIGKHCPEWFSSPCFDTRAPRERRSRSRMRRMIFKRSDQTIPSPELSQSKSVIFWTT